LKEYLSKTHSRKNVIKVQEACNKIAEGLCSNANLGIEALLIFSYGLTSNSIPELTDIGTLTKKDDGKNSSKLKKPDVYILLPEPKRLGAYNQLAATTSSKTNSHVLLEFGLNILQSTIKRNQQQISNYQAFLEPFVQILEESLSSKYLKIGIVSLKCLSSIWSARLEMPLMKDNIEEIVERIYKILHQYATAGIMRMDDNFHLVKGAFKAVVSLLRYVPYFTLSAEQLKVLLLYIEQDLYNADKQAMAFVLLRTILSRKLGVKEIGSVMKKVVEISINAELPRVREEARTAFVEYLLEYPLGKGLDTHLNFVVSQLEYEVTSGRESAVEILSSIFTKFPEVNSICNRKRKYNI
jgi:U3 small nucleolar RNA-associated protein 20